MSEAEAAPGWLNEKDRGEWQWAASYLSSRCSPSLQGKISFLADSGFSHLIRSIHALESEAEGVKLIERLRNAVRQRRYRLAKGGRKTCSFTLPLETKTTLKSLAKGHKTTETALIQRLIEVAAQAAAEQKEGMRRDAQMAKVTRNARKLTQELDKVRIDETRKQLHHCMKQLARWETFLKEELPELSHEDEAAATTLAERRMRVAQEAIDASVAKHEMLSPRSV
ncbi:MULTISPECIES: hypothetical protein [Pseudomonas]|uniref:hypothetical protein n=1 Tax=Pseudomonas TaxID=286 RepID=UPI0006D48735|nr:MULTISPECIES: hypothetical protein [Pseudomonas]MCO2197058.1 hypothetical protein [Pseudomonas aeruginosa]MCO2655713.1 hypothetical protein [Pseudomonas aeruginosa]OBY93336.1 hypothetical protein A6723_009280 [Pseudomonas sp. AU11447]HBO3179815.1 hypothetical protein [Pseudomonas aeruginosa]HEN8626077.1 hypothetical protein [Pseudomonas aeruginosa]